MIPVSICTSVKHEECATWRKTLSKEDTLGVVDLCADPNNPKTLYAVLYHAATGKGKTAVAGTSDLYRSTDAGASW